MPISGSLPVKMDATSVHPTPAWVTEHMGLPNEDNNHMFSATTIIVTLLLMFGLVAHILAVLATARADQSWKEEKRNPVPYFLLNALLKIDFFAVVFFLLRGFATPLLVSNLTFRCEFSLSTNILITWMSGFANVTMCLERCVALMAPFNYRKHVTLFRAKVLLMILMVLASIAAFMPLFGFSSYRFELDGRYDCLSPGDIQLDAGVNFVLEYTVIFFVVGFSTVLIICVSNLVVVCFILRLKTKISATSGPCPSSSETRQFPPKDDAVGLNQDGTKPPIAPTFANPTSGRVPATLEASGNGPKTGDQLHHRESGRRNRKEVKLALIFVLVSMVYTISWLPLYVNRFMIALDAETLDIALPVSICLLTVNHVIDPVIFVLLKEKNRRALRPLMMQCCRCCRKNSTTNAIQSTIATVGHTNTGVDFAEACVQRKSTENRDPT